VGQDEEPFSLVRCADFRRTEDAFRDPVAKAFEAWFNNVEVSKPKVSSHVLEEAPSRFNLSDDPLDRGPEMPRVCCSEPLSGDGEGLAGIASNDSSHLSTPRVAVEGVQISPDRRVMKGTVRNTRCQDFAGSDFVFHVQDRSSAAQSSLNSQVESAGT
jgi:hypothetical protein